MILILLLILHSHLPSTEPIRRTRAPKHKIPLPTRPLICQPHQIKPCISFKGIFRDRPFAEGTSDFQEMLRKNEIFFDNSLFIKTVLDTPNSNPTMLILGPNNWGKTTNLKMLKTFLQIPVNHLGDRILPVENSTIYKLFRYGEIEHEDGSIEKLRIPLRIARFKYLFPMFFGQYPVIYVSFKHVSGTTYGEIKGKIQKAISKAFWDHKYMLHILNEGLRLENMPNAKRKITWFKANLYLNSPFEKTLTGSLAFLCQILRNYFRKNVFVLLDDYDTPLYSALQTPQLSKQDISEVLHLFANLVGWTLRGNLFLRRGVVVGNSQLGQYTKSSWKEYATHSFPENPYPMMQFFGLTRDNFRLITNYYNITEDLAEQALEWYGGFTGPPEVAGQSFCNPTSIIRFLNTKQIASYCHETCNLEVINKLLRISELYRDDVFALLSEKYVQIGERLILNERALSGLQDMFTRIDIFSDPYQELYSNMTMLFHAYLMDQGVLTIVRSSGSANLAKIPNKEITFEFSKRMIQYIREQYHIRQEPLTNAATELLEFIQDSETDSPQLEYRLRLIYARNFILNRQMTNITDEFERPEYVIIECVVLEMQCLSKLRFKVYYDKHLKADIVIRDIETKHATIIQVERNSTARNALNRAKNYAHVLNNTDTSTIKFIGVNVLPSGEVRVRAELQRVDFTYVEPPTTYSFTYPEFYFTTKKSTLRFKRGHGMVIEYPNGPPVTTENPFYN